MHHDGAGAGRVGELDPADEGQEPGGVVGDAVVGPAREVELLHLPHLAGPPLPTQGRRLQTVRKKVRKHSHECETRLTMKTAKNVPRSCFF